jgi:hypothetical protein
MGRATRSLAFSTADFERPHEQHCNAHKVRSKRSPGPNQLRVQVPCMGWRVRACRSSSTMPHPWGCSCRSRRSLPPRYDRTVYSPATAMFATRERSEIQLPSRVSFLRWAYNDDVRAKAADPVCELGHDTARITTDEVVGAKMLVARAVGQHVSDLYRSGGSVARE